MDDNLPNPKTTDTPKAAPPASPPPLDPMTPPDEVQIDPVPLPSVTSQGGPKPPIGVTPTVAFAEEPTIKPPSSAPAHSPTEKKGKTGGGKKVIAGIAALVLLVAALAGGIYLVGVPGSGELRRKAGNTTDINATMTVTAANVSACTGTNCNGASDTNCKLWVSRYSCDSNTLTAGCQDNDEVLSWNASAGNSFAFDTGRTCGMQQIDLGCKGDAGTHGNINFLSYFGPTACGAVASPTPTPAPRWCGNCDTFSCALRPLSECYNADNNNYGDSNPEDGGCDGTCNLSTPTPAPTSTPGPSPTPGTAQCIDVRSQTQTGGAWVDNDLSLARIGDNIRFVARVSAAAVSVSFQITSGTGAPQTVAGTLLSTTGTTKEYAAEYTIPASGQLSVAAMVQ